jgi:hypothetical protein
MSEHVFGEIALSNKIGGVRNYAEVYSTKDSRVQIYAEIGNDDGTTLTMTPAEALDLIVCLSEAIKTTM